jgi:hypothetical protein
MNSYTSYATTALDGLLWLSRENPDLLPRYTGRNASLDIEHRRHDEVHPCVRCGQRAQVAYVVTCCYTYSTMAEPPHGEPRWLDLCAACNSLLYKMKGQ